ncbi:hypothetical protein ColLi_13237 [Colletotrichum liriopes]|uniref:Uncharacterized protein n=1 Tax=Colletotrichum liriopes TaxID=708192 RepID=A0AA37LZJ1_9PEZI|nr:hypothetical protein ColLi_13237 [Colletotrichum liriopes]
MSRPAMFACSLRSWSWRTICCVRLARAPSLDWYSESSLSTPEEPLMPLETFSVSNLMVMPMPNGWTVVVKYGRATRAAAVVSRLEALNARSAAEFAFSISSFSLPVMRRLSSLESAMLRSSATISNAFWSSRWKRQLGMGLSRSFSRRLTLAKSPAACAETSIPGSNGGSKSGSLRGFPLMSRQLQILKSRSSIRSRSSSNLGFIGTPKYVEGTKPTSPWQACSGGAATVPGAARTHEKGSSSSRSTRALEKRFVLPSISLNALVGRRPRRFTRRIAGPKRCEASMYRCRASGMASRLAWRKIWSPAAMSVSMYLMTMRFMYVTGRPRAMLCALKGFACHSATWTLWYDTCLNSPPPVPSAAGTMSSSRSRVDLRLSPSFMNGGNSQQSLGFEPLTVGSKIMRAMRIARSNCCVARNFSINRIVMCTPSSQLYRELGANSSWKMSPRNLPNSSRVSASDVFRAIFCRMASGVGLRAAHCINSAALGLSRSV